MNTFKKFAGHLCTLGLLVAGAYTVAAMAVVFFVATGRLLPGEVMFHDSPTPALSQALLFVAAGAVVSCGFALARYSLTRSFRP